jgi:hypothetical protein
MVAEGEKKGLTCGAHMIVTGEREGCVAGKRNLKEKAYLHEAAMGHRMTEKHHMDQNPCISSLCQK